MGQDLNILSLGPSSIIVPYARNTNHVSCIIFHLKNPWGKWCKGKLMVWCLCSSVTKKRLPIPTCAFTRMPSLSTHFAANTLQDSPQGSGYNSRTGTVRSLHPHSKLDCWPARTHSRETLPHPVGLHTPSFNPGCVYSSSLLHNISAEQSEGIVTSQHLSWNWRDDDRYSLLLSRWALTPTTKNLIIFAVQIVLSLWSSMRAVHCSLSRRRVGIVFWHINFGKEKGTRPFQGCVLRSNSTSNITHSPSWKWNTNWRIDAMKSV
jgi:hypothetical protein